MSTLILIPKKGVMSGMNKVIAFVGIDVADTILYLSRICHNFGSKVVILDYSESGRLRSSVPVAEQIDLDRDCFDYRGVDYTRKVMEEEEQKQYDVVLINLGFKASSYIKHCNYWIYTTDLHKNSIEKLYEISDCSGKAFQLVIRKRKKERQYVKEELKKIAVKLNTENVVEQYYHWNDENVLLQSEYQDCFTFEELSSDFKDYLVQLTKTIYPDVLKKVLLKNMKRAERGE